MLEMVLVILRHPACTQEAKDLAEKLRAELEERLALYQIEAARSRAQSISLDAIARELAV